MLHCYHRLDDGLEMACRSVDKKVVYASFRFYFDDGLFTGQNFHLLEFDFAEEMEGFARYCSQFIHRTGSKLADSWIQPKSEYVEFNLDFPE